MLFLSIHPRFLDRILTGEKTVELRRQRPRDVTGQQVVLYATTPEKQLKGIARVTEIRSLPPQTLWPVVQHQACVTQAEYQRYFEGSDQAVGISSGGRVCLRTSPVAGITAAGVAGFSATTGVSVFDRRTAAADRFPDSRHTGAEAGGVGVAELPWKSPSHTSWSSKWLKYFWATRKRDAIGVQDHTGALLRSFGFNHRRIPC
ncbi:MAG UNVERIFIED_CONTAM: ASCH domain-containing protein [Planctomycetaceae bacterium]|jgi:predicted transcriptional regulator